MRCPCSTTPTRACWTSCLGSHASGRSLWIFDDLTPVFASKKLPAGDGLDGVPFGRGSRVAVGGPPGSGITTVLRRIVDALAGVGDDLDVTLVLAGARPEEGVGE